MFSGAPVAIPLIGLQHLVHPLATNVHVDASTIFADVTTAVAVYGADRIDGPWDAPAPSRRASARR